MDKKEFAFEVLLELLRRVKDDDKNKSFRLNEEKYDVFMDVVQSFYMLTIGSGLKSFEIKNEPPQRIAVAYFYFDKFNLSGEKYRSFLRLCDRASGIWFSSSGGELVEVTVSVDDVWKEVEQ